MKNEVVKLTQELIRIPSFTGCERKISDFIVSYFIKNGVEAKSDKNGNVIAWVGKKGKKPCLLLNGHIDTVPLNNEKTWVLDPFAGQIRKGRLYGLGVSDMKAGIAAMMVALKRLRDQINHEVIFTGVVCEEATKREERERGIVALINDGVCSSVTHAIVGEATNLMMSTGHRGRVVLRVIGRSSHASMPEYGINAAFHTCNFISYLNRKIKQQTNNNIGEELGLNIVRIEGGIADNVIPSECTAIIESRYFNKNAPKLIENFLKKTIKEYKNSEGENRLQINVKIVANRNPAIMKTKTEETFFETCCSIISKIRPCRNYINRFYTDAGYIRSLLGIPVVIFGPGNEILAHRSNEWVRIRDIQVSCEVYYQLCMKLPNALFGPLFVS